MSFYDSTVPVFINILGALNGLDGAVRPGDDQRRAMPGVRQRPEDLGGEVRGAEIDGSQARWAVVKATR